MVEAFSTGDYKQMLEKQTSSNQDVDLILLDSVADANSNPVILSAMNSAVNVCAQLRAYSTKRSGDHPVADSAEAAVNVHQEFGVLVPKAP